MEAEIEAKLSKLCGASNQLTTGNEQLSEAKIDALLMDLFHSGSSETQVAEGSSSTEAVNWVDWSTHDDKMDVS